VLSMGLGMTDSVRGALCQAKGFRLALKVGEQSNIARSLAQEATHLAARGIGVRERVERLCTQSRRLAESIGDKYLIGFAIGSSGLAHYCMGEFLHAIDDLTRGEEILSETPGVMWELNSTRLVRMLALRHMGLMRRLGDEYDLHSRDAHYRNDRFAETSFIRAANIVFLVRDTPDRAADELDRTTWTKLDAHFVHIQHWYQLRARAEQALYTGAGSEARGRYRGEFDAIGHSLLMRMQTVRAEFRWLSARCALAEWLASRSKSSRREVLRTVRRLRKEAVGYAVAWAELLLAAVRAQDGDRDGVAASLHIAMELGERHSILLVRAVAQRRLGALTAGPTGKALMDKAETWMRGQGVVSPATICNVVAPGFPP